MADGAWRVIGHLTPNYATLAPQDHDDPSILRDHLALYGRADDATLRRQIDGVLSVRSAPVTRRVAGQDRLAFARGLRVRLKLDDASFEKHCPGSGGPRSDLPNLRSISACSSGPRSLSGNRPTVPATASP